MTGTRDLNPDTLAAATASTIHPVLFLNAAFDGGAVMIHSELGTLSFGGDDYTGVGILGNVSTADEVSDLSLTLISLSLSGLPLSLVSILFNEQYQGRLATLYIGYLDTTTRTLVDTPTILYRGLIDTSDFEQGSTFAVSLTVGSRFSAWNNPQTRRYNNADQQSRFPTDKGLQFIEQTTNKTVIWGGAK